MIRSLQLPSRKQAASAAAIRVASSPQTLIVPLDQHADGELEACVTAGERVLLGQVIAKPKQPLGAYLNSPVAGHVRALEQRATTQHPHQFRTVIVIDNDGSDEADKTLPSLHDWQQCSPLELCQHLAYGGVVGLGGAAFSSAIKLAECKDHRIEHLLINGMECEPYITCDDRLMRERAADILYGVQILLHASAASQASIAIENDKTAALRAMRDANATLKDARINIVSLSTAYPSGDEGQLIKQLLDQEIPQQGLPADIGVIVHNVGTAYASAQWVLHARPLISRIVTVTGGGIATPHNFETRIGTHCAELIAACDGYRGEVKSLIVGGPMMGGALPHDDYPVVKASNCFIAGTHRELRATPAEMPCIRCGECSNICPVNLLPQQLLAHLRQDNTAAVLELGVFDCIECGCCDFVCPSQIALAARFKNAKQTLRQTVDDAQLPQTRLVRNLK